LSVGEVIHNIFYLGHTQVQVKASKIVQVIVFSLRNYTDQEAWAHIQPGATVA
jgi:hypothetical protein